MDNYEAVIVALFSLGIVIFGLSWRVFSKGQLFHNRNQGLTFFGVILSILGFISIFTTFFSHIYYSLTFTQGPYFTLLEGSNICNSLIGAIGSASSEDFLTGCRTINMAFYLSIIALILGIIFIMTGLIKRK